MKAICECDYTIPALSDKQVDADMDTHAWVAYASTPWSDAQRGTHHKMAPVRHDSYRIVPGVP